MAESITYLLLGDLGWGGGALPKGLPIPLPTQLTFAPSLVDVSQVLYISL